MQSSPPTNGTCGACRNLDASSLAGYGYCRAGLSEVERARFLPRSAVCVWQPSRYQAAPVRPGALA